MITGAGSLSISNTDPVNSGVQINTTTQTGGAAPGLRTSLTSGMPSAGFIGERISNYNGSGSSASGSVVSLTNIALTPGIWDISMICEAQFSGVATGNQAGISTSGTAFTGSAGDAYVFFNGPSGAGYNIALSISAFRIVLTANTTYFLVVQSTFTTGGNALLGRITGVRVG